MNAEITEFERKLVDALRAYPDRSEMWAGLGYPLRNHRNLIALYTRFFEICNTHNIAARELDPRGGIWRGERC